MGWEGALLCSVVMVMGVEFCCFSNVGALLNYIIGEKYCTFNCFTDFLVINESMEFFLICFDTTFISEE